MLAAGGAGTICGMANLIPQVIRTLYDEATNAKGAAQVATIERLLVNVKPFPFFAAFKALMADHANDPSWSDCANRWFRSTTHRAKHCWRPCTARV